MNNNKQIKSKMKELRVEVPQGYEIDKENSSFECIKFKPKGIKTIEDLYKSVKTFDGYWVFGGEVELGYNRIYSNVNKSVFLTEKEAKSALAMSQISQLMPYYGGAITDEEWDDRGMRKFVIVRHGNRVIFDVTYTFYEYLAFYTKEQRDSFYKNNEQLVKEYLMTD